MSQGSRSWRLVAAGVALAFGVACGGKEPAPNTAQSPTTAVSRAGADVGVDLSRCEYKGRADRSVVEGTGPGSSAVNIRKVFAVVGTGEDARKMLVCREVDTNLDGQMDVVRTFNDKGDAISEQADADYDGQIDTWMQFARGRVAKLQRDTNGDGKPDETRHYIDGKLSRVQRDTNFDGKPDVWEIYSEGTLERMGLDLDHDGHVDRWDRDMVAVRQVEARERAEEEAAEKKAAEEDAGAGGGVTDARVSARNR